METFLTAKSFVEDLRTTRGLWDCISLSLSRSLSLLHDSIDSTFKTTFQILGVGTAGLLFILASRDFVGTRADINHPEYLHCTNDDRRNDVNYFCRIASLAYNLYASLVKSQRDK